MPLLHPSLFSLTAVTLALAGGLLAPDLAEELSLTTWSGWWSILRAGVPYAVWVLLILGAHEMGHYLTCRRYRIPVTLPFFLPGPPPLGTFGAVLRIRGRIPDRRALFDVAAAGPLAGLAVALPVLVCGILSAEPGPAVTEGPGLVFGTPLGWVLLDPLWTHPTPPQPNGMLLAGWVGAFVTSLNLFPVGQLDGGHVAYAVSRPLHRWLAFATIVSLATLVLVQGLVLRQVPAYLVWLGLLAWMRDRHPPVVEEATTLGAWRLLVACLLALIWVACLIPVPLRVVSP